MPQALFTYRFQPKDTHTICIFLLLNRNNHANLGDFVLSVGLPDMTLCSTWCLQLSPKVLIYFRLTCLCLNFLLEMFVPFFSLYLNTIYHGTRKSEHVSEMPHKKIKCRYQPHVSRNLLLYFNQYSMLNKFSTGTSYYFHTLLLNEAKASIKNIIWYTKILGLGMILIHCLLHLLFF